MPFSFLFPLNFSCEEPKKEKPIYSSIEIAWNLGLTRPLLVPKFTFLSTVFFTVAIDIYTPIKIMSSEQLAIREQRIAMSNE